MAEVTLHHTSDSGVGHEGDGACAGFTKQAPTEALSPGPDLLSQRGCHDARKPNLAPTDRPHREARGF